VKINRAVLCVVLVVVAVMTAGIFQYWDGRIDRVHMTDDGVIHYPIEIGLPPNVSCRRCGIRLNRFAGADNSIALRLIYRVDADRNIVQVELILFCPKCAKLEDESRP